jgi:hypothetical protein
MKGRQHVIRSLLQAIDIVDDVKDSLHSGRQTAEATYKSLKIEGDKLQKSLAKLMDEVAEQEKIETRKENEGGGGIRAKVCVRICTSKQLIFYAGEVNQHRKQLNLHQHVPLGPRLKFLAKIGYRATIRWLDSKLSASQHGLRTELDSSIPNGAGTGGGGQRGAVYSAISHSVKSLASGRFCSLAQSRSGVSRF